MSKRLRIRGLVIGVLALVVAAAALLGTAAARSGGGKPHKAIPLADATMIVEVNATDGDAGLQVFLDGEPWKAMKVSGPDGRRLVDVRTKGKLKNYGLTELFSESSEPPFTEFPLEEFKKLFPEGRYTFAGKTIEGRRLTGAAMLSHDIPAGPEIIAPEEDETVSRKGLVARWGPGDQPAGVEIVAYRAIVSREDPLRVLSVDLPASVRHVSIPSQFLERGIEYKLEVQAIEESGNQTLTEISFTVG